MKVIKYGADVQAWKYNITCYHCKSELEVTADDLKFAGEAGDWHDSGWERYSFNCAACTNELQIDPKEIPLLVRVKAEKRGKK